MRTSASIVLIYSMVLFFLYPILAHILMYDIGYMIDELPHGKFWLAVQIFFSGPSLIVLGAILMVRYRRYILNQLFGLLSIAIGLYWIYVLIETVINEAA